MTTPDPATIPQSRSTAYWQGWNDCMAIFKESLRHSGDIDWTACTMCGRGMFVPFNDGMACCDECAAKEVERGN